MVKKDKGVVDHNDGGEAESESGIVVPPHKCSNFSLAVMLTARQVCPVVEGHDAAGSASLTELGPLELVRRGYDFDEPWTQHATKPQYPGEFSSLGPPVESSSHTSCRRIVDSSSSNSNLARQPGFRFPSPAYKSSGPGTS
ncbi:hypothetical protein OsI_08654 [Oryza sativa Indica Group]|uniref:Uncharacterized protein n=1 Tax=Oryza sativa subsp. indica TaxID=39946 RepID=A2X8U2_ORYSI|nr:hypothetical protein OsI_08654 [Oryza sativa Indica Group]